MMRRVHALKLGLGAVVAALIVGWSPAPARASVNCGDTITTSVVLSADLNCGGGTGLLVVANNVTVDFGGHTLGCGTVVVTGANVTIKNGSVSGCGTLIGIDQRGNNLTVSGMTITNCSVGVEATGAATGLTVRSSVVSQNIDGVDGSGVNVSGSRITLNADRGIVSVGLPAHVTSSIVSENNGFGIAVFNAELWLIGNRIAKNAILISNPNVRAVVYVADNILIDSPLIPEFLAVVIDGGGNRGINCSPFIVCSPL